jgi:hypothetical protein
MHRRLLFFVLTPWLAVPALAQPSPQPGRIPTVTRLVKQFSELEASVVAKAHAQDRGALDAVLDPSFEMRIADRPGVPVPRDASIRQLRAAPTDVRIDQMAVHDLGDIALVSFRATAANKRAVASQSGSFIVDCWKRAGDEWKLAVRYAGDASAHGLASPAPGRTIDKRY